MSNSKFGAIYGFKGVIIVERRAGVLFKLIADKQNIARVLLYC